MGAHVNDVYARLGHTDLLDRCLTGNMQNNNESLHSVVWRKCPKTGFVGLSHVVFATFAAVSQFNAIGHAMMQRVYNGDGDRLRPSASDICRESGPDAETSVTIAPSGQGEHQGSPCVYVR